MEMVQRRMVRSKNSLRPRRLIWADLACFLAARDSESAWAGRGLANEGATIPNLPQPRPPCRALSASELSFVSRAARPGNVLRDLHHMPCTGSVSMRKLEPYTV